MLFSVVIPVYNVEKYLEECLESIVGQALKVKDGCEVILVDDGSTDSSGKICDEYCRRCSEIFKVFHNTNHGLLYTRRFGYKQTCGEYIVNCDSDDVLECDALEKLEKAIKKYNFPEIIIFNHYSYDGKNKVVEFQNVFSENKECEVEKKKVLIEYLSRNSIVSVWGKLIKRNCIDFDREYSKFRKISTGEDTLQSIEFFNNAKSFVYLNEVLYSYRCGSGMTGKCDENYYFTFKSIFEEILKKKQSWNLNDFDLLFSIKVLQTAGRAITQSRYKKWNSIDSQKNYLKKIYEDEMFKGNIQYLSNVKEKLQTDHWILLWLLNHQLYGIIIFLLNIKNQLG